MKRTLGLILFWVAFGMLLMMLLGNNVIGTIIVVICFVLGYNLYC